MSAKLLLSVVLYLLVNCKASAESSDAIIQVPQGKVIGEWRKAFDGRAFAAFEGIPYAKAPVGKRRFRDPQPPEPWQGDLIAKIRPRECLQWYHNADNLPASLLGDEDCLFLNVYSPKPQSNANLPVIVYIHGGAFIFGSGIQYGPLYLMEKNVVLVTINYRLGLLGFMSTQDEVVPGNMGLKDQRMALQWVKNNINAFGGNPNSVTVFGMSAGGASVHFHMLSPSSKGLIHQGISQSGTAFCPWTFQHRPLEKAQMAAEQLGCPTTSTRTMVDCLREKPGASIVNLSPLFMPFLHAPFSPFAPVIEPYETNDPFITQHPYDIMHNGGQADIPWIMGVTASEGLYPGAIYVSKETYLNEIETQWDQLVPNLFDFNETLPNSKHIPAAEKIKQFYMKGKPITMDTFPKLVEALGDRHFKVDIEKAARLQSSIGKKPIYLYQFDYKGQDSLSSYLSDSNKVYGVSHGDDTGYIMRTEYMNSTTCPADTEMMRTMTEMVASFALTGVPNVESVTWDPVHVTDGELNYLNIMGPRSMEIKWSPQLGAKDFWESLGLIENEAANKPRKDEL